MQPELTTADTAESFNQWVIIELFGHQRFAGHLSQANWPPGFGRLEIPATDGHDAVTQLINPSSIYRLTPTTEAIATAVAAQCRPAPVHRWELPAVPAEPADDTDVNVSLCTCEPGYDGEDDDCPVHGDEDDTRDVEGGPF